MIWVEIYIVYPIIVHYLLFFWDIFFAFLSCNAEINTYSWIFESFALIYVNCFQMTSSIALFCFDRQTSESVKCSLLTIPWNQNEWMRRKNLVFFFFSLIHLIFDMNDIRMSHKFHFRSSNLAFKSLFNVWTQNFDRETRKIKEKQKILLYISAAVNLPIIWAVGTEPMKKQNRKIDW